MWSDFFRVRPEAKTGLDTRAIKTPHWLPIAMRESPSPNSSEIHQPLLSASKTPPAIALLQKAVTLTSSETAAPPLLGIAHCMYTVKVASFAVLLT